MSDVIEMKTAELTGNRLRWATGMALGLDIRSTRNTVWVKGKVPNTDASDDYFDPLCWAQAGPLRDKYRVSIEQSAFGCGVRAQCWADGSGNQVIGYPSAVGDTALIAISRAIVAATFGDTVPVPIALTGGAV